MSVTGLLLFPGNPGSAADFASLLAAVDPKRQAAVGFYRMPLDRCDEPSMLAAADLALAEAQAAAGGVDLRGDLVGVAYSFGAYMALRWAKERGLRWRTLVLLCPTLVSERPVSPLQRVVLGTPLVGDVVLRAVAPKLAAGFVATCFAPGSAADGEGMMLQARLAHAPIWRAAMQQKIVQTRLPLEGSYQDQVQRLVVLRGGADAAVPWPTQEAAMERIGLKAESIHVLAGAGHSLLWSHRDQVVPLVVDALAHTQVASGEPSEALGILAKGRIGYQAGKTPRNNVLSYLYDHAQQFPDRVAIRWVDGPDIAAWSKHHRDAKPHRQVTFLEFMHLVDAVAAGLAGLGITTGDRVIIFLPMSLPMYVAMFAVQKLGAIAVFLDSWARSSHLGASAACATPKAMISHKAAFELIAGVEEFKQMPLRVIAGPGEGASYSATLEQLLQTQGQVPLAAVTGDATALITFTTGSSGTPKGANRTHRFLCAQHEALAKVLPYTPVDIDMPAFPIFSLNNLASGVTTILPAVNLAAPASHDGAALVGQIIHGPISCTTLSPSMLNGVSHYCLEQGVTLPSLRRVVTGGAPISKDDVAAFKKVAPHAEIWVLYGSTEVEPMAHIEATEMLTSAFGEDPEIVEEGVNVGHISDELRYKFIHIVRGDITLPGKGWADLEVAAGEVGEFIVTGDHVCRDYYNNPEAFRKSKIVDQDGSVWHRTGDLGRLDKGGNLWIVGRIHNVIERGGRYFFPVRAEVILKRLAFVENGAFLGLPDPALVARNAVVLQLRQDATLDGTAIAEAKRLLAKNGIPVDSLYAVEEIPMDPRHHSKVEYGVLRDHLEASQARDYLA